VFDAEVVGVVKG